MMWKDIQDLAVGVSVGMWSILLSNEKGVMWLRRTVETEVKSYAKLVSAHQG
jgi:hypothetical protein